MVTYTAGVIKFTCMRLRMSRQHLSALTWNQNKRIALVQDGNRINIFILEEACTHRLLWDRMVEKCFIWRTWFSLLPKVRTDGLLRPRPNKSAA